MADTNNYRAFTLWIMERRICSCKEYTPTKLGVVKEDFKTGAMDMSVPLDGGMEAISTTFKIAGVDRDVFQYLGLIPGVHTRIAIYSAFTATTGGNIEIIDTYEGIITSIEDDARGTESKADVGSTVTFDGDYFRRTYNGRELIELIPAQLVRRINGVDTLAGIANILRV